MSLLSSAVIRISEIVHGSEAYQLECALRNRILREPLGLSLYDEDLEREQAFRHFGAYEGDRLVGCLIAVPLEGGVFQLKQMAIDTSLQGRGLGRQLMVGVESRLGKAGARELRLHARESAIGFYERLGFAKEGRRFEEIGIPHFLMRKSLAIDEVAPSGEGR